MKNLLMIAYYFPPLGGVGVQRTLKFVKYLRQFGWEPIVLTVKNSHYHTRDESLTQNIAQDISVYRATEFNPIYHLKVLENYRYIWRIHRILQRWLYVPDSSIFWLPFAIKMCTDILNNHKIDVIYTTSAPYSAHLAGYYLKRKYNLPWVADFRDPWTDNPDFQYPTKIHDYIQKRMEKRVMASADLVVANTNESMKLYKNKYNGLIKNIVTIRNGYDPEDFEDIPNNLPQKFTITYSGSIYGSRTSDDFIKGISEILTENIELRNNIQINLVGNCKESYDIAKKYGCDDVVNLIGFITHKEALKIMVNSHVLLLITHSSIIGNLIIPAKFYEYIACRRPIMAIIPQGEISQIIDELNIGIVVEPGNVGLLKNAILRLYNDYINGIDVNNKLINTEMYRRKYLTEKLSNNLNKLIQKGV